MNFLSSLLDMTIITFQEASIYIVLGFCFATFIHLYITPEKIIPLLGEGKTRSIIMASILGIPLPLCSCSILPTAISLKKKGIRNGPIFSFLISTPETGVDSIALTYGMMGGLMTVARPLAAVCTAFFAGYWVEYFSDDIEESAEIPESECSCSAETDKLSMVEQFAATFNELFDDVSGWLVIGLLISAATAAIFPQGFFENYLSSPLLSMLVMALVGIPLYICASASTPIVAALLYKGLNPGAALVFLLAGPATNAASILALKKTFGTKLVAIYLLSILVMSLLMGFLLNGVTQLFPISLPYLEAQGKSLFFAFLSNSAVIIFLILVLKSFKRKGLTNF